MDFNAVCFFVAVYEAGNVSRASDALGRVQSSVSLRLIKLEQAAGEKLFERRPHGLQPTKAGVRLYAQMKPAVEHFQQAQRRFRESVT